MNDRTAKTILIVDDEQTARHLLRYVLQLDGYNILSANDAFDAIKLLEEGERPDLIISDIMMPGMLGSELVQHLAAAPELAHVPVILISANHDRSLVGNTAAFVHKPFTPAALLALVAEILAEPQPPINSTRQPRLLTI
ncbi:MAG TPA: response regulator [Herpetosiphonaceae bacterium]|nr:response regulator [Herpetosiphonaceae bacterium]